MQLIAFCFGYSDKVPDVSGAELDFLVEVVVGSIYKGGGRFAEHEKVANVVHFPLPKPLNFAHSCAWAPVCPSSSPFRCQAEPPQPCNPPHFAVKQPCKTPCFHLTYAANSVVLRP
jgi:hypothetical protein